MDKPRRGKQVASRPQQITWSGFAYRRCKGQRQSQPVEPCPARNKSHPPIHEGAPLYEPRENLGIPGVCHEESRILFLPVPRKLTRAALHQFIFIGIFYRRRHILLASNHGAALARKEIGTLLDPGPRLYG